MPHYFDIVLFAMVAFFLVLRLRAVLGRRTGDEQPRTPVVRQPEPTNGKVIAFGRAAGAAAPQTATPGDAVAAGLARIRGADAQFDPAQFLEGARGAFEIIVAAFAAGDKSRLRPLLHDDVLAHFTAAIDERNAAKETLETRIVQLKRLDIIEAEQRGQMARVTVKIVSDQINVLRAHDGSIVDGDPDHAVEKTDLWSFARDTGSSDPNWQLVATDSG